MWVVVHALSGLALGTLSPLGLGPTVVGAIVLHVLLDLIPHWDYTSQHRRLVWAGLDLGTAVVVFVAVGLALDIPAGAFVVGVVSALPDLDVFDAVLPGTQRRRWFPSHWRRFPHGQSGPGLGIPIQAVVAALSLAAVGLVSV